MKGYRFAINEEGEILVFDLEFRKEIYNKYVRENGLIETNILDAFEDWTQFEDEKPDPLPQKYTGDIIHELQAIYIDMSCLAIIRDEDIEIAFEDCVGTILNYYDCFAEDYVDIPYNLVCELLTRMGYSVENTTEDGQTIFVVI